MICSNLNSNFSNSLDLRKLQEQVKKAFCYQKLFWPFTVLGIPKFLKILGVQPQSFSRSPEQFFLIVGQNNFGNKIPVLYQTKNRIFLCLFCIQSISLVAADYIVILSKAEWCAAPCIYSTHTLFTTHECHCSFLQVLKSK